jgi:hypothetical protein
VKVIVVVMKRVDGSRVAGTRVCYVGTLRHGYQNFKFTLIFVTVLYQCSGSVLRIGSGGPGK